MVYPHNGLLLSNKREQATGMLRCHARHERPILNDSIYKKCPEKPNVYRQNRLAVCWGWEQGLTVNVNEGFYCSNENVLNLIYDDGCTIQ